MRTFIAFLALVAVVVAQRDRFDNLIHHEVVALLQADPNLTVDQCTTKCDALFDLVDAGDEQHTDDVCKRFCTCEINKTCGHHPTTAAPHHTHPPHPTHPPHGHHP